MKISNKWSKLGLRRQYTADKSDLPYGDETSLAPLGGNPDDAHVTDSPNGTAEELSSSDTMTVRTLTLDDDSTYTVEESAGVDPYNTGRFDAASSKTC
jgi:hypothetical protein